MCCSVVQYVGGLHDSPGMLTRVLQCVAVCCSVLQRVAVCCSVLQCVSGLHDLPCIQTSHLTTQWIKFLKSQLATPSAMWKNLKLRIFENLYWEGGLPDVLYILKSQLATQFAMQKNCRAHFWECFLGRWATWCTLYSLESARYSICYVKECRAHLWEYFPGGWATRFTLYSQLPTLLNLLCKRTLELIFDNVYWESGIPDLCLLGEWATRFTLYSQLSAWYSLCYVKEL